VNLNFLNEGHSPRIVFLNSFLHSKINMLALYDHVCPNTNDIDYLVFLDPHYKSPPN